MISFARLAWWLDALRVVRVAHFVFTAAAAAALHRAGTPMLIEPVARRPLLRPDA